MRTAHTIKNQQIVNQAVDFLLWYTISVFHANYSISMPGHEAITLFTKLSDSGKGSTNIPPRDGF